MNRFLIIRPDRIGDVVLSTAIPREIKKKLPHSFIAVLLREYTKDIYVNNPYIDQIIVIPNNQKLTLSFIKKIRFLKIDIALTLLPNKFINKLLFWSGIKLKIGVGHKFYQFLSNTKGVYRNKYIENRHESEYCLDLIRKIGIKPTSRTSEIFLSVKEQNKRMEIRRNNGNKLFIGINTTSGNSAPNLSLESYIDLINLLLNENNLKIVITDLTPDNRLKNIKGLSFWNEGKDLRESIINFSSLDLLISASTGPMHIASSLGVSILALFCPLPACHPDLWGPIGNSSKYILLPEEDYCSNKCPGDPKLCKFENSKYINPKQIADKVKEITSLSHKM